MGDEKNRLQVNTNYKPTQATNPRKLQIHASYQPLWMDCTWMASFSSLTC